MATLNQLAREYYVTKCEMEVLQARLQRLKDKIIPQLGKGETFTKEFRVMKVVFDMERVGPKEELIARFGRPALRGLLYPSTQVQLRVSRKERSE